MTYPLISVIIPLYNVEPYIVECLNSVVCQNYKGKIECIVVNDCSTDNSAAIVSDFIAGYKGDIAFRLLHHKHNSGQSTARNTGLDSATGQYIYFIDSDDFIDADAIQGLYDSIISGDYAVAIGNCVLYRDGFDRPYRQEWIFDSPKVVEPDDYADVFFGEMSNHAIWNKLYKREIFDQVRFRDGKLNEDSLFIIDSAPVFKRNNYRCIDVPQYTYHYRYRVGGTCRSPKQAFFFDCMQNLEEAIVFFQDKPEMTEKLRRKQLPHVISTIRYQPRDKAKFLAACRTLKNFNNASFKVGNTNKAFIHTLLFKYFPHLSYLLDL